MSNLEPAWKFGGWSMERMERMERLERREPAWSMERGGLLQQHQATTNGPTERERSSDAKHGKTQCVNTLPLQRSIMATALPALSLQGT